MIAPGLLGGTASRPGSAARGRGPAAAAASGRSPPAPARDLVRVHTVCWRLWIGRRLCTRPGADRPLVVSPVQCQCRACVG